MSFTWYKTFPDYPDHHPDYWRIRLIFHIFLLATVSFALLSVINLFVFKAYTLAVMDGVGCLIVLALYGLFRRLANVAVVAVLLACGIAGVMLAFILLVEGRNYSVIWATVIPPVTFFLAGRRVGTTLSIIVFVACVYTVYLQLQHNPAFTINTGALLNVIEASIVHILLFRFYEGTRYFAFQQAIEREQQLIKISQTDTLTGIYNRNKFAKEYASRLASGAEPYCLAVIDIDHFKLVNDTYGHAKGDAILVAFAQRLMQNLRGGDVLARWGGEEFVILISNTTRHDAKTIVERWKQAVSDAPFDEIPVTFSAGITVCDRLQSLDSAFKQADNALYTAKQNGRNRVSLYRDSPIIVVRK